MGAKGRKKEGGWREVECMRRRGRKERRKEEKKMD